MPLKQRHSVFLGSEDERERNFLLANEFLTLRHMLKSFRGDHTTEINFGHKQWLFWVRVTLTTRAKESSTFWRHEKDLDVFLRQMLLSLRNSLRPHASEASLTSKGEVKVWKVSIELDMTTIRSAR